MFAGPPVSTSVDFDESIFGPLHHHHKTGTKESRNAIQPSAKREEPIKTTSFTSTEFNESILAPILGARNDQKKDRHVVKDRGHESPQTKPYYSLLDTTKFNESVLAPIIAAKEAGKERKGSFGGGVDSAGYSDTSSAGGKRKRSTFELMMESLEKPSEKSVLPEQHRDQKVGAPPPPVIFVPSHASYKCKEPCLPTSGEIPTLTASEGTIIATLCQPLWCLLQSYAFIGLREKGKFFSATSKGNISVLHEVYLSYKL